MTNQIDLKKNNVVRLNLTFCRSSLGRCFDSHRSENGLNLLIERRQETNEKKQVAKL